MSAITRPAPVTPWLTLPDGWNDHWSAAKAASGSTPATIAVYGDSVSQGYVATDWKTQGWFELVRANLLTRYSLSGDFYLPVYNTDFAPSIGTMPFTIPTGFGAFGNWGFLQTYLGTVAQLGANPLVFNSNNTPTPAFVDADIHLLNWNGGTATYSIDGGSNVVLTSFNDNGAYMSKFAIATQASAAHIINFTAQSVDNACGVAGISTFQNRSAGLFFSHFAASGWSAANWGAAGGAHPVDRILIQQGIQRSGAVTGYGTPVQPDLAIVALGINDCQNQYSIDGFEGNLRRFCQSFRRGKANASILFVIPSCPDPVNSEITSGGFTDSQNYPLYIDRVYKVAAAFGCAVANVHAKWANRGVSLGFQAANQPHPTVAGQADIALLAGAPL